MCDLCKAVEDGDAKSVSGNFCILICRTCHTPMIVFKHHRSDLNPEERQEMLEVKEKLFPDKQLRGYMRSIPDHWHDHLT